MTALDQQAAREARRQYARAVDKHFDLAHQLVRAGDPDAAEKVAKGAAILRWDARLELAEVVRA